MENFKIGQEKVIDDIHYVLANFSKHKVGGGVELALRWKPLEKILDECHICTCEKIREYHISAEHGKGYPREEKELIS